MRQFYFVNNDGQRYQLQNGTTKTFLWEPGGLGFEYDIDYKESDGFFFNMNTAVAQVAKTGTLVFHGTDPYSDYKALMDYLAKSTGLRLAYAPKNNWYYVDIDVESVDKTEIELDGTLQCSIVMMPKTPFYLPYELNIDLSGDVSTDLKKYDYEYDYRYGNSSVGGEVEFSFDAQMDSGLEIIINGSVSAPVVEFFADGEQIGEIDLSSASASVGEYIRYSSIPTSAGVYKYASGTETEITSQIGLNASYPTFFMIPPNKTIKAVLSATSLTGVTASIKVYEYFRSV